MRGLNMRGAARTENAPDACSDGSVGHSRVDCSNHDTRVGSVSERARLSVRPRGAYEGWYSIRVDLRALTPRDLAAIMSQEKCVARGVTVHREFETGIEREPGVFHKARDILVLVAEVDHLRDALGPFVMRNRRAARDTDQDHYQATRAGNVGERWLAPSSRAASASVGRQMPSVQNSRNIWYVAAVEHSFFLKSQLRALSYNTHDSRYTLHEGKRNPPLEESFRRIGPAIQHDMAICNDPMRSGDDLPYL